MEMRIFVLLLSTALVATSIKDNGAKHTTQVEADSGSRSYSGPSGNEPDRTEKEQSSSKEKSTTTREEEVHSGLEADKPAEFSGNSTSEGDTEALKKAMARIDPNAVLKVEIKIHKNKSRRKNSVSSPKGSGFGLEVNAKSDEENRDGNAKAPIQEENNGMRNANSLERASPSKRSAAPSSVSYQNGRDTKSGRGLPLRKQIIEVVPCKPKKPAPANQSVSVVSPHSLLNGDTRYLDNFEGGLSVLCILSKNINLIKEKIPHTDLVGRVRDVLVLKNEENYMKDYWGHLSFIETNGTYVDKTGFYEGKPVSSTKELLYRGKLTKNGVYQSKDLSDRDVEKDFQVTKFLLNAISKAKGTSVSDMERESCDLPLVDKLLFARRYTYKETPKKETVCICSDGLCKGPCKEVKQIDAKKLE